MNLNMSFGGGGEYGTAAAAEAANPKGGPSIIASVLDLLGIGHQVAKAPKDKGKGGSDPESAIEDGTPGDQEEDGPVKQDGIHKLLNMFDSTLGTQQRTGQQNFIPPTPPRVLWGPGMKGFGGNDGSGFSGF